MYEPILMVFWALLLSCINYLSVETLSCLNVETEPRTKWSGDGETEPMENLHLGNGISALAIMNKFKNGHHFIDMCHMETFQMTDPPPQSSLVF